MNKTPKGLTSKIQHCSECETRIQPIWKGHPDQAETWFWTECCECDDFICEQHAIEDEDKIYCITCYSGKRMKK